MHARFNCLCDCLRAERQSERPNRGLERDRRERSENCPPRAACCRAGFCYRAFGNLRRG